MSLLPNQFRIHDDMPLVLERVEAPAAEAPRYAPACELTCAQSSDKPPKLVRLRLTDWAESESENFKASFGDRGCTCFISPPCCSCLHPGNPINQAEDPEAWVMGFEQDVAQ